MSAMRSLQISCRRIDKRRGTARWHNGSNNGQRPNPAGSRCAAIRHGCQPFDGLPYVFMGLRRVLPTVAQVAAFPGSGTAALPCGQSIRPVLSDPVIPPAFRAEMRPSKPIVFAENKNGRSAEWRLACDVIRLKPTWRNGETLRAERVSDRHRAKRTEGDAFANDRPIYPA